MNRLCLAVLVLLLSCIAVQARSHYSMVHNRFGALKWSDSGKIEGDLLVVDNTGTEDIHLLDTTRIDQAAYTVTAVFANRHNREGRRYRAGDTTLDATRWGIVVNRQGDSWIEVQLSCSNSALLDDLTDRRTMTLAVLARKANRIDTIATTRLERNVELTTGMNALRVDIDGNRATIAIGKKQLKSVLEVTLPARQAPVGCGALIGSGACVEIERLVLAVPDRQTVLQATAWTVDSLTRHFADSHDPIEGFWIYQDREMENQWLRLGGRYTLAMVANGLGYDLIYIDGAKVSPDLWHEGMLKGRLKKTIFGDHYDLYWIDATGMPITEDAYASIDNGVLLTLRFPIYKSQLRLSKVLTVR